MSPGRVAPPPGMFSAAGDHADDVDRQLHLGDRAQRAEHRGRAAHVVLHLVHLGGRLQRDAAGVEGDALADQRPSAPAWRAPPSYCSTIRRGGCSEPWATASSAPIFSACIWLPLEHLHLELELACELRRGCGAGRPACTRCPAGCRGPWRDRCRLASATAWPTRARPPPSGHARPGRPADPSFARLRLPSSISGDRSGRRPRGRARTVGAQPPVDPAARDIGLVKQRHGLRPASVAQVAQRAAHRLRVIFSVTWASSPIDTSSTRTAALRIAVDHQRRSGLRLQVARAERRGQRSCRARVYRGDRRRELAPWQDRDDAQAVFEA